MGRPDLNDGYPNRGDLNRRNVLAALGGLTVAGGLGFAALGTVPMTTPSPTLRKPRSTWTPAQIALTVVALALSVIWMAPLVWALSTSLKTPAESVASPHCQDWLAYHYYDADDSGTPKLGLNRLSWTKDGWPSVL
ncbi:hypothetical protein ACFTY8_06220 [Streptomyces mirabilis]|uniref:hypothetical protein n=1 Tax=Streptomyces mirabilis TaxID=68239 RepID=UPI003633DD7B